MMTTTTHPCRYNHRNCVKTADLSILVQALKAELAVTLQGTGPFTVFAPTNAAFTTFYQQLDTHR
jgi:uncharacterized surface protein with fasciclin (FAS1) repeats